MINVPAADNNLKVTSMEKKEHMPFCAKNAWNFPSFSSLIKYDHATEGFSVKETWCKGTHSLNYALWPNLTVELATRYFPDVDETTIVIMSQKRKNVRSTKIKKIEEKEITVNSSKKLMKSIEAHIFIRHS